MKQTGLIIEDSIQEISEKSIKNITEIKVQKRDGKFYAVIELAKDSRFPRKYVEYECDAKMKDLDGGELISRRSFRAFKRKFGTIIKTYCYGKVITYAESNMEFLRLNDISLYPSIEYLFKDTPILMPILQNGKIGFINDCGEIVFEPEFEEYDGVLPSSLFERYDGDILVKRNGKWGVINWERYVVDTKYDQILRSITYDEDNHRTYRVYTVKRGEKYAAYNYEGDIVLCSFRHPYSYISGFDSYLAIVKRDNKFGLANVYGDIVLPIEYDKIDEFYGKELKCTKAYKNGKVFIIKFSDLVPVKPEYNPYNTEAPQYNDYDPYDNSSAYNNPYYNDALDFDQQEPEFWENL